MTNNNRDNLLTPNSESDRTPSLNGRDSQVNRNLSKQPQVPANQTAGQFNASKSSTDSRPYNAGNTTSASNVGGNTLCISNDVGYKSCSTPQNFTSSDLREKNTNLNDNANGPATPRSPSDNTTSSKRLNSDTNASFSKQPQVPANQTAGQFNASKSSTDSRPNNAGNTTSASNVGGNTQRISNYNGSTSQNLPSSDLREKNTNLNDNVNRPATPRSPSDNTTSSKRLNSDTNASFSKQPQVPANQTAGQFNASKSSTDWRPNNAGNTTSASNVGGNTQRISNYNGSTSQNLPSSDLREKSTNWNENAKRSLTPHYSFDNTTPPKRLNSDTTPSDSKQPQASANQTAGQLNAAKSSTESRPDNAGNTTNASNVGGNTQRISNYNGSTSQNLPSSDLREKSTNWNENAKRSLTPHYSFDNTTPPKRLNSDTTPSDSKQPQVLANQTAGQLDAAKSSTGSRPDNAGNTTSASNVDGNTQFISNYNGSTPQNFTSSDLREKNTNLNDNINRPATPRSPSDNTTSSKRLNSDKNASFSKQPQVPERPKSEVLTKERLNASAYENVVNRLAVPVSRDVTFASVRGQNHVDGNIPCEDACYACQSPDRAVIVGCVCDGAGSQILSGVGAKETCRLVASKLAEDFAEFWRDPSSSKRELLKQIHEQFASDRAFVTRHKERLCEQIKRQAIDAFSNGKNADFQRFKEQTARQIFEQTFDRTQSTTSVTDDDYRKVTNEFWNGYLRSYANTFMDQLSQSIKSELVLECAKSYCNSRINIEGIHQFACTVVAFAIRKNGDWIALHLGDGGIVGRNEYGELKTLSIPENGKHGNETYFVTNSDAFEHLRVVRSCDCGVPANICDVLLFSDGPETALLKNKTFEPASGCNNFIDKPFLDADPDKTTRTLIEKIIKPGTCDDCSLLVIRTRRKEDHAPKGIRSCGKNSPPKEYGTDNRTRQNSQNFTYEQKYQGKTRKTLPNPGFFFKPSSNAQRSNLEIPSYYDVIIQYLILALGVLLVLEIGIFLGNSLFKFSKGAETTQTKVEAGLGKNDDAQKEFHIGKFPNSRGSTKVKPEANDDLPQGNPTPDVAVPTELQRQNESSNHAVASPLIQPTFSNGVFENSNSTPGENTGGRPSYSDSQANEALRSLYGYPTSVNCFGTPVWFFPDKGRPTNRNSNETLYIILE